MPQDLNHLTFPKLISGPRITLSQPNSSHTSFVWDWIQRDHHLGGRLYSWIESTGDVEKYITNIPENKSNEICYLIFINELVIGSFHIQNINDTNCQAEVGYSLEKGKEGHGYASEALQLIEPKLKNLGFKKLIIKCSSSNQRSSSVAIRNGFKLEKTIEKDRKENGELKDSLLFEKLIQK